MRYIFLIPIIIYFFILHLEYEKTVEDVTNVSVSVNVEEVSIRQGESGIYSFVTEGYPKIICENKEIKYNKKENTIYFIYSASHNDRFGFEVLC